MDWWVIGKWSLADCRSFPQFTRTTQTCLQKRSANTHRLSNSETTQHKVVLLKRAGCSSEAQLLLWRGMLPVSGFCCASSSSTSARLVGDKCLQTSRPLPYKAWKTAARDFLLQHPICNRFQHQATAHPPGFPTWLHVARLLPTGLYTCVTETSESSLSA